jgi:GNAT superfamily N-acetyltransferase
MDDLALARTIKRLAAWMDDRSGRTGLIQHRFESAPFGNAYVCISPGDDSPFASANHNRVHLCGTDGGLTRDGVLRFASLFDEAGVGRFFVWLSPGPNIESVRAWVADAGLSRVPFVAYPTLARGAHEALPVETDLEVRELLVGEAAGLAGCQDEAAWPEYLQSAGAPGYHHFIALDRDRPVASAVLCVFENLGYLCMARTAEPARRRGAQRALIAKRIEKARALGCRTLASETLSIVPISLGNLQKAGFQTVYEKEVYERKLTTHSG